MQTHAVLLTSPENLAVRQIALTPPGAADVVVDIAWSGISTGTERLLYTGQMPAFPGMGYPLVPGYESVGVVAQAGSDAGVAVGSTVFVPGANCYGEIRGLFGGSASRVVTQGARVVRLQNGLAENATLLALAATAQHAVAMPGAGLPDLIVGHGTLGRLAARLTVAAGGAPVVWERNADRAGGGVGYSVVEPEQDPRRDYRCICDVSGDASLLDVLIGRLAPGGAIVLAGFYDAIRFAFPPAFMREVRLFVAAQWQKADLAHVVALVDDGGLSLDGLITHRQPAAQAADAYRTAFGDPSCLKMILDWRDFA